MNRALSVVALTVVAGCSASKSDDAAAPLESQPDAVVLGHFVTRDHRVTWLMAVDGPRFTVRTSEHVLLASELNPAEIEARFPELGEFVRSAVAGDARAVLDASASYGY